LLAPLRRPLPWPLPLPLRLLRLRRLPLLRLEPPPRLWL